VRNGLADLSFTVQGYTPGRFVTTQIAEFQFLGDSAESTSVAFQRVFAKTPAMQEEHKGVKVLAVFTHGPGMVFNTKKPINNLADLQGLKFRIGGGLVNEISKSLGMNVTLKPAPESYELLSTGVMDGTLFPAESVQSFKIDKVVKYATTFPGGLYNTAFVFMMNQAKYDSLPPDVKKAIDEMSGEFAARMYGRSWDKADRLSLAFMQAAGVQVTKADAALVKAVTEKTDPLVDGWAKAAEAKGMKDPKKALADFRAEIKKL
jgi:TRAP-type C4-dicarboxylate transport system substrate-binding protein